MFPLFQAVEVEKTQMTSVRLLFDYPCGNICHYGHFLVDAVLPFALHYDTLLSVKNDDTDIVCWLQDIPSQHMGHTFTGFFRQLFPRVQLQHCSPAAWRQRQEAVTRVVGLQFGPYPPDAMAALRRHVDAFLASGDGNDDLAEWPRVVLIERGFQPVDVPRHGHLSATDTGARRRHLRNHAELRTAVASWCAAQQWSFHNVVLENMSLRRQILYFRNARIIVGQHGAGLCNLVFALPADRNHVVFEMSYWGLRTIKHLADATGRTWVCLPSSAAYCQVSASIRSMDETVHTSTASLGA